MVLLLYGYISIFYPLMNSKFTILCIVSVFDNLMLSWYKGQIQDKLLMVHTNDKIYYMYICNIENVIVCASNS